MQLFYVETILTPDVKKWIQVDKGEYHHKMNTQNETEKLGMFIILPFLLISAFSSKWSILLALLSPAL